MLVFITATSSPAPALLTIYDEHFNTVLCCGTKLVWGSRLGTNNPTCLVGIKVRDKLWVDNSLVSNIERIGYWQLAAGQNISGISEAFHHLWDGSKYN